MTLFKVSAWQICAQMAAYMAQGWSHGLRCSERLSRHQTLASARRSVTPQPHEAVPRDRLDLALSSHLRHGSATLVRVPHFYTQPETMGVTTWYYSTLPVTDHEQKEFAGV